MWRNDIKCMFLFHLINLARKGLCLCHNELCRYIFSKFDDVLSPHVSTRCLSPPDACKLKCKSIKCDDLINIYKVDPACFMIDFDENIDNHDYFGVCDDYVYQVEVIYGKPDRLSRQPFHIPANEGSHTLGYVALGPLLTWIDLVAEWISNHIHSKMCGEITYPFPNLDGATVDVWEWISNFIPPFTGMRFTVIRTYAGI